MSDNKRFCGLLTVVLVAMLAIAMMPLAGCISDEAKEGAKQKAAELAADAGDIAGEMTASWLGTTGANFEKNFDQTIAKRLEYLEISIDKIDYKASGKNNKLGVIEITINNSAPASEKMFLDPLFDDNHYLVACDQNGYAYSVYPNEDRDQYLEERYASDDVIKPGKSRVTIYTEVANADTINSLLFIGKTISVPKP